jgi:hypothetical protein
MKAAYPLDDRPEKSYSNPWAPGDQVRITRARSNSQAAATATGADSDARTQAGRRASRGEPAIAGHTTGHFLAEEGQDADREREHLEREAVAPFARREQLEARRARKTDASDWNSTVCATTW